MTVTTSTADILRTALDLLLDPSHRCKDLQTTTFSRYNPEPLYTAVRGCASKMIARAAPDGQSRYLALQAYKDASMAAFGRLPMSIAEDFQHGTAQQIFAEAIAMAGGRS